MVNSESLESQFFVDCCLIGFIHVGSGSVGSLRGCCKGGSYPLSFPRRISHDNVPFLSLVKEDLTPFVPETDFVRQSVPFLSLFCRNAALR